MNAVVTMPQADNSAIMERVLLAGDLSKLTSADRLFYYQRVCESVGLNPLTRPFDYLTLNGKQVLYAKRDATDQLRKIHAVSITISGRETINDVHVVTARARDKSGREDESTGAVTITGLKGDALANALMKAETKAKRRVTLSICGLGLLDETEIDDARGGGAIEEAPEPPEGYAKWKADMDAKVSDGYEAFKQSWQAASKDFRLYANTHDKAWREAIPEKAKQADAARPS